MTIANKREQIWRSFNDKEYRHQFVGEEINVGLSFQIRSLRNRQDLKQGDLAKLLGVKQPLISAWEDPNYGKYSLSTLKDLAKAFDVGLLVRFVPFSVLADLTANLTSDLIAPANYVEEVRNHDLFVHINQMISTAGRDNISGTKTDSVPQLSSASPQPYEYVPREEEGRTLVTA
jgi:transcriptional regulator with XRE-family HTH domain